MQMPQIGVLQPHAEWAYPGIFLDTVMVGKHFFKIFFWHGCKVTRHVCNMVAYQMLKRNTSEVNTVTGLSGAEALFRLKSEGPNELPAAQQRALLHITLEVLGEPMFLLLVSAGAIYLLLGDVSDALMLLGFIIIVMGITVYQEYKTERVLEALRDLTSPRALVMRDKVEQRIPGREVVRGDMF